MLAYLKDRQFLRATALLAGAMVGVGIFGIPFAFAKSGFLVGMAWLAGLAVVTALYNLIFAEVTLRTQGVHQTTGYANIWLGPWARRITLIANLLSGYGALLAYMIIVGEFLHTILGSYLSIDPTLYSVVFTLVLSFGTLVRLRTVAAVDVVMMAIFGGTVAAIFTFGIGHIDWRNFQGTTAQYWFLPYGVVLFALAGASAVPLQRQLLIGRERLLRPAIVSAVIFVTLLYAVFAFTVVGVSGDATTPEALAGLAGFLGPGIIFLGSLFGVLTISTSFLMMGTALFETFHLDYRMRPLPAWLLVTLPPLLFFISGLRSFIDVIGLVGSVSVGLLSIIVISCWLKARHFSLRKPEMAVRMHSALAWVFILFFCVGIVYSLVSQWPASL